MGRSIGDNKYTCIVIIFLCFFQNEKNEWNPSLTLFLLLLSPPYLNRGIYFDRTLIFFFFFLERPGTVDI
jgi:hypothetical protein